MMLSMSWVTEAQSQVRAAGKAALGARRVGSEGCSTCPWQKARRPAVHLSLCFSSCLCCHRGKTGAYASTSPTQKGHLLPSLSQQQEQAIPTLWDCCSLTPLLLRYERLQIRLLNCGKLD